MPVRGELKIPSTWLRLAVWRVRHGAVDPPCGDVEIVGAMIAPLAQNRSPSNGRHLIDRQPDPDREAAQKMSEQRRFAHCITV